MRFISFEKGSLLPPWRLMSGRSLPNSLSQLTMRLKKSVELDLNCMEKLTNDCGFGKSSLWRMTAFT